MSSATAGAKKIGQKLVEKYKSLKYFRFDREYNVRPKGRMPHIGDPNFATERLAFQKERSFMDAFRPFVAYLTAPDEQRKNDVVGEMFEAKRMQLDILRKNYGFNTNGMGWVIGEKEKKMQREYDKFEAQFSIIARKFEKVVQNG